jgi:hypothetical protein
MDKVTDLGNGTYQHVLSCGPGIITSPFRLYSNRTHEIIIEGNWPEIVQVKIPMSSTLGADEFGELRLAYQKIKPKFYGLHRL